MICRLKKALYGLKKAHRTWYARLDSSFKKFGFAKGTTNSNLYLKEVENGFLIIVIFFDDIMFGGNYQESNKISKEMKNEFEMSMIGEMQFFLGLQIV